MIIISYIILIILDFATCYFSPSPFLFLTHTHAQNSFHANIKHTIFMQKSKRIAMQKIKHKVETRP